MTIAKITAGDGYLYLLRHVAQTGASTVHGTGNDAQEHDATAYYTADGNPAGHWLGRGARLLGLEGQEVTEDHMRALFGYGAHPDAEAMIAEYLKEHVRAGMTDAQLEEIRDEAIRSATLGRRFPQYEPLETFSHRVEQRLQAIRKQTGRQPTKAEEAKVKAEESRRQRAAVAGFDLVFSPVKSAALLWAIDDRPRVREAIRTAHENAMHDALDLIEDHAAYTRTGTGGLAQIETRGLTAAAFEHWDSRAGDPNLHTHVAVSTKAQGTDGRWRSLDARALYHMAVAASELYNTAFETHLAQSLGVTFTARPDTRNGREPVREITGIPTAMTEFFSRRRAAIETRYTALLRDYRTRHGHDPDAAATHQLAQRATLDTRQAKQPPRALADKRAAWRDELTARFGARAVAQAIAAIPSPAQVAAPVPVPFPDLEQLAQRTVAAVSARRSTWTVWHVRAEAERLLRTEAPGMTAAQHTEFAEVITSLALSPGRSLCVEAPALLDEPAELRRSDGQSVFEEHAAERYTSEAVLDAEQRLLDATRTPTVNGLANARVAAALDGFEALAGVQLDAGQRALVTAFAADDRLLLAGIGPAGAGKTTAMRAYAHVLRQSGRRLVPLATSAASADVLGSELTLPAENLHKFLHEWTDGRAAARLRTGESVPADIRKFALGSGDVVLVDEAGMAGTFLLDELVSIATRRGATVRLLGDDRQLSAVESGGALRLITAQPGTPELTVLHRFDSPEEANATLQIRTGDGTAIDWYAANDRIQAGSREAMAQAAYDGWKADMLAGKTTLMAAGDGADVIALSAQARADRVTAGQVEPDGVLLRDGNRAGAGDWIVTRDNNRRLCTHGGRDWVKNGDAWHVERRHADGSLVVRHTGHGGRVRLPADYVAGHVQLLYATTAYRVQGSTVDSAHPLITGGMTREVLYVLASRAREKTTFYVATHDLPFDEDAHVDRVRTDSRSYAGREVLLNVVATEGRALSATETIEVAAEEAESLAMLVPEYLHAAHQYAEGRYRAAAVLVFGETEAQDLLSDSAWGAVVRRLYDAEAGGWEPARLLKTAADVRELDTAGSIAEVVSWRIDRVIDHTAAPPRSGQPYETLETRATRLADVASAVLGVRRAGRARNEITWPALIAALERAESMGHDPGELLASAINDRELSNGGDVSEVLALLIGSRLNDDENSSAFAFQATGPTRQEQVPLPWITAPPVEPAVNNRSSMPSYLADGVAAIGARVRELGEQALRTHPAWLTALGRPPAIDRGLQEWLRHVAVIAAFRDQHRVQTDDPHQVLGPYLERGHAGHKPYWNAAESVLEARRLAGLDPLDSGRGVPDAVRAQVAADIYNALPDAERIAIADDVAAKAAVLWFGDRSAPDEDAAVQTAYSDRLVDALTRRGHLSKPDAWPPRQNTTVKEPVEATLARPEHARSQSISQRLVPNRDRPTARAAGQSRQVDLPVSPPDQGPTRSIRTNIPRT